MTTEVFVGTDDVGDNAARATSHVGCGVNCIKEVRFLSGVPVLVSWPCTQNTEVPWLPSSGIRDIYPQCISNLLVNLTLDKRRKRCCPSHRIHGDTH